MYELRCQYRKKGGKVLPPGTMVSADDLGGEEEASRLLRLRAIAAPPKRGAAAQAAPVDAAASRFVTLIEATNRLRAGGLEEPPTVDVLGQAAGSRVSAAERDAAWAASVSQDDDED